MKKKTKKATKQSLAIQKFVCCACNRDYPTRKEAHDCSRLIADHFKTGDLVLFNGNPYRIFHLERGDWALNLEHIKDYRKGFGLTYPVPKGTERGLSFVKTRFCKDDLTLLPLKAVTDKIEQRKDQLRALERVKAEILKSRKE